jgi:hypothetical protein
MERWSEVVTSVVSDELDLEKQLANHHGLLRPRKGFYEQSVPSLDLVGCVRA